MKQGCSEEYSQNNHYFKVKKTDETFTISQIDRSNTSSIALQHDRSTDTILFILCLLLWRIFSKKLSIYVK